MYSFLLEFKFAAAEKELPNNSNKNNKVLSSRLPISASATNSNPDVSSEISLIRKYAETPVNTPTK